MSEKAKIVMIDDEEDLCIMVKANLEDSGKYDVVTNSDPQAAESFIKQENPDLILLDVVMPGRKGDEVVEAIKKDPDLKKKPIIMVSGKGEMVYQKKKDEFKWMPNNPAAAASGDLAEGRSAETLAEAYGVDDYISKPFTTELLTEVIEEVLSKYRKKNEPEEDPMV